MATLVALLLVLALFGHWALCVGAFNRAAGSRLPCWVVGKLEKLLILLAAVVPVVFVVWLLWFGIASPHELLSSFGGRVWLAYLTFCLVASLVVYPTWLKRKLREHPSPHLVTNDTQHYDVAEELGHWPVGRTSSRIMSRFPRNEICQLAVPIKTLRLPSLPPKLDRLSIVQLSDLHFTGQLTIDYYQYVVERANELNGDLVVITGDIVDRAECIDWIPETLGRLTAKRGVYFVLGNHDKRIRDIDRLRKTLTHCGLTDVGGRAITLDIADCELHLAGNELPWFPLRAASEAFLPQTCRGPQFRVLLSHSPDQYVWARERGFDLMLAGHCHGGQIRLPIIGPIVSPSRYGARYASGLFYEPPTVLHVSRGLAGTHPIRLNCLPELTKLVLMSEGK